MCLHARWYFGSCAQCCRSVCSRTFCSVCLAVENLCHDIIDHVSFSPDLAWRDIQHLTIRTAEVVNADDPDWDTTAAGRPFSYKYGYGRLNGFAFVTAAQQWQLVKPQTWVELPAVQVGNGTSSLLGEMSDGLPIVLGGITSTTTITQEDLELNNFEALEHVTVRVWITHDRRGDVEVEITSPKGITSVLAARRRLDADKNGFPGWRFMSVKHWSVICHLLAIRMLNPLEGMRTHVVHGQFVSPILVPRVARATSSAGSSPSLVRRSTRLSHANTNFPYSKNSSPPLRTPIAHQQSSIPLPPRRKYIRSRQTIYLGIMARPRAKRLSQHLMTVIHQRAPLRVGLWCPQRTKAGSPICPPWSRTRNGSSAQRES